MAPPSAEKVKKLGRDFIIKALDEGQIGEDRSCIKRILEEKGDEYGLPEGHFDVLSESDLCDLLFEVIRFQKEQNSPKTNSMTYESTSQYPRNGPSIATSSSSSGTFAEALPSPPETPPGSKDGEIAKKAAHPKTEDAEDAELPEYIEVVSSMRCAAIVP
jgi:hypothetical protein